LVPLKKINTLKSRIKQTCTCQGVGCLACQAKINRMERYAEANIPMDYWFLPFKNFEGDPNFKKIIIEKLETIDDLYNNGESLAFIGKFGLGKTYATCCILKQALLKDFTVRYDTMSDVINNIVSSKEESLAYLEKLKNVDFLAIDEFGKRWVFPSEKAEQLFGQNLEFILRTRFQNHLPTILCSNDSNIDQVLSEDFSRAFSSLKSQYIEEIFVGGIDFRKKIGKEK
jgi:DNA replication protein DnaC